MGRHAEPPKSTKQASGQSTAQTQGAKRRKRMFFAVMALFVIWAGSTLWNQNDRIRSKNEALEVKLQEYKAVEQSLNQLKHEVERLNDPEYIGQIARKKFGLYLPNETPIIQPQNPGEKP